MGTSEHGHMAGGPSSASEGGAFSAHPVYGADLLHSQAKRQGSSLASRYLSKAASLQYISPSLASHIQLKRSADPGLAILPPPTSSVTSQPPEPHKAVMPQKAVIPPETHDTPAFQVPSLWSHGRAARCGVARTSPTKPAGTNPASPSALRQPSTGFSEAMEVRHSFAAVQHRSHTESISSSKASSGSGSAAGGRRNSLDTGSVVAWGPASATPTSACSGVSSGGCLPGGPPLDEALPGCLTDEEQESDSEEEWADTDSDDRRVGRQAQRAVQLFRQGSAGQQQQLEQASRQRASPVGRPPLTPTRSLPHNQLSTRHAASGNTTNSTIPALRPAVSTSILGANPGPSKVLLPTDSTNLVFWGGVPIRRPPDPKKNSTQLSSVVGMTGKAGTGADSRPGTASTLWTGYDLEEGVLERLQAQGMHRPGSRQSPSGGACSKTSSKATMRRGSTGGKTSSSPSPSPARLISKSPSLQPAKQSCVSRTVHPAVVMDVALMKPCATPIAEVPLDEKGRCYPYVLPPAFPGACPSIAFAGGASAMQAAGLHPLMRVRMFVRYAGIANSPVKTAFKEAGWRVTKGGKKWSVCWGHIFTAKEFANLHEFQRVNHFPGTWEMGRKDYLYRNVAALKRIKGDALDFIPRFFILPRDRDEFQSELERHPGRLYIQKPVNSSRGRGVRMVTDTSALLKDATKDLLVQHYVANPYTLNGYKFDMRLYVMATCMDPLRLYIYHEGLARLATQQYTQDKSELKKRCVHLTNYSVNKKSSGQAAEVMHGEQDDDNTVSKWSLGALRAHITQDKGPQAWQYIWRQVHDIVAGAMLSAEPRISTEVKMKVPHRNICFEVWGFDVLLDDSFRAWLMEVNTCPSLAADSPLDRRIKNNMVADAMNLVGPVPYDAQVYDAYQEAKRQSRLTGLPLSLPQGSAKALARSASLGSKSVGGAPPVVDAAAAYTGTPGGLPMPKTVKEAEQIDFKGMPLDQLPDVIVETEAEYARRRGWERVFPCPEDPERYLGLFETPRAAAITLCKYYAQKAGGDISPAGQPATNKVASNAAAGARAWPSIGAWRPGGFA